MRFVEFNNGLQTYVNLEEQNLLTRVSKDGVIKRNDLSEREQVVAHRLTQKNILIRQKQDEQLNYKVSTKADFTATY